jgi:hypothetical protein
MSQAGIIVTTGISGERKSPQVNRASRGCELLAEGALRFTSVRGWFLGAEMKCWCCETGAVLPPCESQYDRECQWPKYPAGVGPKKPDIGHRLVRQADPNGRILWATADFAVTNREITRGRGHQRWSTDVVVEVGLKRSVQQGRHRRASTATKI